MSVTNKVKVRKIYPFSDNKKEPNKNYTTSKDTSQMPISAEFLRGSLVQFFGIISLILFVLYIINIYITFANKYSALNKILMVSASATLIFPCFIFVLGQTFLRKYNLKNITNKSMGFSMIIVAIIAFIAFNSSNAMGLQILFQLMFIFASMFFFAISKELGYEENKEYIISYFSALTSFVALIVSLVALFK